MLILEICQYLFYSLRLTLKLQNFMHYLKILICLDIIRLYSQLYVKKMEEKFWTIQSVNSPGSLAWESIPYAIMSRKVLLSRNVIPATVAGIQIKTLNGSTLLNASKIPEFPLKRLRDTHSCGPRGI